MDIPLIYNCFLHRLTKTPARQGSAAPARLARLARFAQLARFERLETPGAAAHLGDVPGNGSGCAEIGDHM